MKTKNNINTALYIASRMLKNKGATHARSKPIIFLAVAGITLGIAVMILSISIAMGFQREIREKIVGFGSHVQITNSYNNNSYESSELLITEIDTAELRNLKAVTNVQIFAYKPAIIQSRKAHTETDGSKIRDIQGVVFKGIGKDFDKQFFKSHLIKGAIPTYETSNDSIVISRYIADKLRLDTADKIAAFFVRKEGPKQRNLTIAGIYETGLEDFDDKICFIDINQLRQLNGWGIKAHLKINEDCKYGFVDVEAIAQGGNKNYRYKWGEEKQFTIENRRIICPIKDTVIRVVVSDFESYDYNSKPEMHSVPDTAWLTIKTQEETHLCDCKKETLNAEYINDSVTQFQKGDISFITRLKTSGGSSKYYSGGIEVLLTEFKHLSEGRDLIENFVSPLFNITTVVEQNEEIFNWLEMLDMNVYIIIGLMILVAIINMTSALMVMILEKTQMIGILKAVGADNWLVRKIFIYNGAYLILKGIILGNLLAYAVIFVQNKFHVLTLPQENYYVSIVPMDFPVSTILIVNAGAFLICYLALVLPSFIVTKITPVKAIRFE